MGQRQMVPALHNDTMGHLSDSFYKPLLVWTMRENEQSFLYIFYQSEHWSEPAKSNKLTLEKKRDWNLKAL